MMSTSPQSRQRYSGSFAASLVFVRNPCPATPVTPPPPGAVGLSPMTAGRPGEAYYGVEAE